MYSSNVKGKLKFESPKTYDFVRCTVDTAACAGAKISTFSEKTLHTVFRVGTIFARFNFLCLSLALNLKYYPILHVV